MLVSTKIWRVHFTKAKKHLSKLVDRVRGIETEEERFNIARARGKSKFIWCLRNDIARVARCRNCRSAALSMHSVSPCTLKEQPSISCFINAGAMLGLITLDACNLPTINPIDSKRKGYLIRQNTKSGKLLLDIISSTKFARDTSGEEVIVVFFGLNCLHPQLKLHFRITCRLLIFVGTKRWSSSSLTAWI